MRNLQVKVGKVTYKTLIVKLSDDLTKDTWVLKEDKIRSQVLLKKHRNELREVDKEELDIRDSECEASLEEEVKKIHLLSSLECQIPLMIK